MSDNTINALQLMGSDMLAAYMGSEDMSTQLSLLPERLEWDKRLGCWRAESLGDVDDISMSLVASTTIWAIWTDKVGQPETVVVGTRPYDDPRWQMGIRILLQDEDGFFYYLDCFGLMGKTATSAIRRAQTGDRSFKYDGFKDVNTRYGGFRLPKRSEK